MTNSPLELDSANLNDDELVKIVEAILFITDEPLQPVALAATLGLTADRVEKAFEVIQAAFDGKGIELRQVNHGYRLYTAESIASYVEMYVRDGQVARLTQAALETLAVIAYKQPVSRARVSAIRGVNVDGVVKTLESRGLIEVESTDSDTGAMLFRTTGLFLEKMGINSLEDLPAIADYLPELATVEDLEG